MAKKKATATKPSKEKSVTKPAVNRALVEEWESMTKQALVTLAIQSDPAMTHSRAIRMTKDQLVQHLTKLGVQSQKPEPLLENQAVGVEEEAPVEVIPVGSWLERFHQTCPLWFARLAKIRDDIGWNENQVERLTGTDNGVARLFNIAFAIMQDCKVQSFAELAQIVRLPNSFGRRRYNIVVRRELNRVLHRSERESMFIITEAFLTGVDEFVQELDVLLGTEKANAIQALRDEIVKGATLYQELQVE